MNKTHEQFNTSLSMAGVGLSAVVMIFAIGCSDSDSASTPEAQGSSNTAATSNSGGSGGSGRLYDDVPICNYQDDPGSCEDWVCYEDETGVICERSRTDYPDSRPGWECSDDTNPGYTTCVREGEDAPGGGSSWSCMDDANGNQVCTRDDPGGYNTNGDWDCEYTDEGVECTRTDGPAGADPSWECYDDADGAHCTSDDPANANDDPGGGGWECVNDGDTRICDDDHDGDEPGRASDNPTGTEGWTCEDTAEGRVCVTDDPGGSGPGTSDPERGYDTPDGGENWNCEDLPGERICVQDDPGGSGSGGGNGGGSGGDNPSGSETPGWDCEYDEDTDTTTCIQDPDTPTEDSDWECFEPDPGRRVCEDDEPGDPGSGGGTPGINDCGDPIGNIRGRVCAPSGDFWIVGADVSVTFSSCNGEETTLTTQTDIEGYFLLSGVVEGQHTVTVSKGPYERTYEVNVVAGETFTIPLGDFCFDQSTAIAVVTGQYDQIERVLDRLGFEYTLFNGYPENNGARELLGDLNRLNEFDVVFMNCGTTFRGIFDDPRVEEALKTNIRQYVEGGGRLYVSDWDWLFWETAVPESFDFHGADDTSQLDVLQGNSGYQTAYVVDPELRAVLGEQVVTLNFDYPNWAIVDAVPDDVRVFLKADVELVRGGIIRDIPVLMSHKVGEGEVLFTSYHIHENQSINQIFSFTVLGFD